MESQKINFEVINLIVTKKVHHPNDVTNRYLSEVIPKILHRYFRLPGKFVRNYTTKIIRRDGSEGEMDWLILVEPDGHRLFERILINVEFQSSRVTEEKIKIITDYRDYAKTYYGLPVLSVIVITDGYDSSELEYSRVESDILKPVYIFMDFEEIIKRLNNLEEKINNNEQLNDDEGLDIVFLPMFAPKKDAKWITEKVTRLFDKDKSLKGHFKNCISHGLSFMIKKYFDLTAKVKELLDMLEPEVDNSRLRMVVEFEMDYERRAFEKELAEKDEAISVRDSVIVKKEDEIKLLKQKLEENGIEY